MYLFFAYIKFLFRSTNQHGVHSPFVYELVTKCFYDKKDYREYKTLNAHRKALLKNRDFITVNDLGQGSRVFRSNRRSVAAIAKHAGVSRKRQRLLFRLARYFDLKSSIELGTSVGLATTALALYSNNHVHSIEGCKNTAEIAKKYFDLFELKNITLYHDTFENILNSPLKFKPDLVYFDGNHSKKNTLGYFYALLPQVHNDTIFIFDDIHWSKEMTGAWEEIKQHPKVTVSIDTFYWGIVFFRKEQQKETFNIRV